MSFDRRFILDGNQYSMSAMVSLLLSVSGTLLHFAHIHMH